MTDNLFGRTLKGEVQAEDSWPHQDDTKILIDKLDELLAMEHVSAVRWDQYTPSFNDGEPCRFGTHCAYVRLDGLKAGEEGFETNEEEWYDEDDEIFLSSYDLYTYPTKEDGTVDYGEHLYEIQGIPTKEIKDKLEEFESLLDNKAHYVWLMKTFGDPARVTATDGEFEVEFCEHE